MPRTTKDVTKKEINEKKATTKNTTKAEKSTNRISVSKTKKEANTKKSSTKTKKVSSSKDGSSSSGKKKTTTTKKASSSRTKKTTSSVAKKESFFAEYYDLPYRYNQTTVKLLAQTPQMLFVYWDISDEDLIQYINRYGEDFFNKTRPVLLVHNETMNYTFEVQINDFANSWYLQVADPNCKYIIELGRRPNMYQETIKEPYIYITSSNKMDTPNDHILFEKFNPNVTYKNVKTGEFSTKDFSKLSNFKNMQNIYGIYNLYKEIYKNELFDEIVEGNLSNPSSLSSSQFK